MPTLIQQHWRPNPPNEATGTHRPLAKGDKLILSGLLCQVRTLRQARILFND